MDDLGQRVAEARSTRGLTQAQLAAAAGVDRSALAKIETGLRRVSAVELVAIARELRRRVEWFVEPGPPSIVSYRTSRPELAPQAIDDKLEQIVRDVEFVVGYVPELVDNQPEPRTVPRTVTDAERLAVEARSLLGLSSDQPAVDLDRLVQRVGLLAFAVPLGDGADAGTVLLLTGGVSVVNGDQKVGRRRLALAHEFGHYLVADPYTTDWRVAADGGGAEGRLDRFARSLLLPEADLRERWSRWTASESLRDACVLAGSHYRVDMATLARRLTELRLITSSRDSKVREVRTKKADIVERDLLVPHEMELVTLPLPYQRAVLDLYRREIVTADRALGLLLGTFDDESLPDLPEMPESGIWDVTS